jgi:hypothetical protein
VTSAGGQSAVGGRGDGAYLTDLTTPPPGTVRPSDRQPFDPDFGEPLP